MPIEWSDALFILGFFALGALTMLAAIVGAFLWVCREDKHE